jgi:hypothetical protein
MIVCGKIDQHNCAHRVTLGIEVKLKIHDWSKRVALTILSMCMVDAWKVWSRITVTTLGNPIEEQKRFYAILAAELIENQYDGMATRGGGGDPPPKDRTITMLRNPRTGEIRRGLDLHLISTKRKCKVAGRVTLTHFPRSL